VSLPGPDAIGAALDPTARLVVVAAPRFGEPAAGIAAVVRARAARPAVLVLANRDDPAADALSAADPGARVVHKPFLPSVLIAAARELVGRKNHSA